MMSLRYRQEKLEGWIGEGGLSRWKNRETGCKAFVGTSGKKFASVEKERSYGGCEIWGET